MLKVISFVVLLLGASLANANEFENARITGVIFNASKSHIEFTIDIAPKKIFSTKAFEGTSHEHLANMIIAAYRDNRSVSYIRVKDYDKNKSKVRLPIREVKFANEMLELPVNG